MDEILDGGLVPDRFYLLKGPPGGGKTVWASQLCFHVAHRGAKCVYATLATESHGMLVENLRGFDFFEERLIPNQITLVSGLQPLREGGLAALDRILRTTIQSTDARLLVIDGLAAVLHRAATVPELQQFVRDIAATCSLLSCTAICTMPIDASDAGQTAAVEYVADAVVELSRYSSGLRTARMLEVWKYRGSAHLTGKHLFDITRAGVTVHARTESRAPRVVPIEAPRRRSAFGIDALDRMLHGGVMEASTTALLGAPGAGKTLLGLQFLGEGARRRESAVYFGFFETPDRLVAKAEGIGLQLGDYVAKGLVELIWQPGTEYPIDALASRLLDAVRRRRARRLFIDSVDGFRTASLFPERLVRFFTALTNEVRALGVTTLLSEERGDITLSAGDGALSACFENIVMLRYVELRSQLRRLISIVKMRESDYDTSIHEFTVKRQGIEVASSHASAEEILRDLSRGATEQRSRASPARSPRGRSR